MSVFYSMESLSVAGITVTTDMEIYPDIYDSYGIISSHLFLKLVSAIFYQILVFPPNDSPPKTMKSVFYFIEKALFVLEIFKLL